MSVRISFKPAFYNDNQCETFYSIFRNCSAVFGCFYMAYVLEDITTKTRFGFTTNPDWQEQFIGNSLIDECHVWNAVNDYLIDTSHSHLILPWSMVKPKKSIQKDMILYREEFGIGQDAISFCTKNKKYREYIAFAPTKNENGFLLNVSKNMDLIKKTTYEFRTTSFEAIEQKKQYTII